MISTTVVRPEGKRPEGRGGRRCEANAVGPAAQQAASTSPFHVGGAPPIRYTLSKRSSQRPVLEAHAGERRRSSRTGMSCELVKMPCCFAANCARSSSWAGLTVEMTNGRPPVTPASHVASARPLSTRSGDATLFDAKGQSSSTTSWRAAASASAWAWVKWTGFCFFALRHSRNGGISEMMMIDAR